MLRLLFVCTGNATRSVLAGALVSTARPDWVVHTAGTFAMEGAPMSWRTRVAMTAVEVSKPGHRAVQLETDHLDEPDLVVALAGEHVHFIRMRYPHTADRTGTLRRLVRDLPAGTSSLRTRVAELGLASVALEPWEDVEDPAGHDVETFVACAHEIRRLTDQLVPKLDPRYPAVGTVPDRYATS